MRPGLDLDLSHHGVADDPADQASEPVAHRVGHHYPVLALVGGLSQLLGEFGERHSVHGEPAGVSSGHLDAACLGPAAQGVIADPQQAGHEEQGPALRPGRVTDPDRLHRAARR